MIVINFVLTFLRKDSCARMGLHVDFLCPAVTVPRRKSMEDKFKFAIPIIQFIVKRRMLKQ